MNKNTRIYLVSAMLVFATTSTTLLSGCTSGSNASKGAKKGATTGAVAGAAGGMLTALVFGGNVAEAGARGAVYGGASGAVAGGMSGAEADKAAEAQKKAEREAELEKMKKRIGTDAYNGVVALVECKHNIAIANAREAVGSSNSDYSLAGTWVEVLAEADRQGEIQSFIPTLIENDSKINNDAEAKARIKQVLVELGSTREEYNLPAKCSA